MDGMKRIVWSIAIILAGPNLLWAAGKVPWVDDVDQARQLARQHQRLVLMHFWSPNCPPCRRLEQRVLNRPEVVRAIATNYVPVKVNVNENKALAAQYRVTKWPTDVIVTASGKEVYRGVSQQDPIRFVSTMDQVAAHARLNMPPNTSASSLTTAGHYRQGDIAQTSSYEPAKTTGYGAAIQSRRPVPPSVATSDYSAGQDAAKPQAGSSSQFDARRRATQPEASSEEMADTYGGSFQLPGARKTTPALSVTQSLQPSNQTRVTENPYAAGRNIAESAPDVTRMASSPWRKSETPRTPSRESLAVRQSAPNQPGSESVGRLWPTRIFPTTDRSATSGQGTNSGSGELLSRDAPGAGAVGER